MSGEGFAARTYIGKGGPGESLVGRDGVVATATEIEKDRAGDDRDISAGIGGHIFDCVGDASRHRQSVARAAGQCDRVYERRVICEAQTVRVDRTCVATAHIDSDLDRLWEIQNGCAGGALLIFADPDLDIREVKRERGPLERDIRLALPRHRCSECSISANPLPEFPELDIRTCRKSANIEEELASEPANQVMKRLALDRTEVTAAANCSPSMVSTQC